MKLKSKVPTEDEIAKAKEEATDWARERLADTGRTLIIDTETTGILSRDPRTEICQISIINTSAKPVLSMLLKPNAPMGEEAYGKHGILPEMVANAPTFDEAAPILSRIIRDNHLVAYNAAFDIHLLTHLYTKYEIEIPEFETSCAMEAYSKWMGRWEVRKGDWKWHRLPQLAFGQAHDALTDCVSTLLLMRRMVGDFDDQPDPNDIDLDF